MARSIINISIPESMKLFVEMRAEHGYGSVSDYFRQLIRKDEKKYLKQMDAAIEEQSMYRNDARHRNREVDLDCDY